MMKEIFEKERHDLGTADALRFIRAIDCAVDELDHSAYGYGYHTTVEFMDLKEELFAVQKKLCDRVGGIQQFAGRSLPAYKVRENNTTPFREAYLSIRKERFQKRAEKLIKTYDAAIEMLQECELTDFIRAERAELTKEALSWAITEDGIIHCPNCYFSAPKNEEGEYKPTTYCPHCGQKRIYE